MCGIAGGVAVRGDARVNQERLRRMAALLAHRGPDAEGFWSDPAGRAGLAHRRLSVIDLAGGSQPMCGTAGATALVFNGEIYNYREERELLTRAGVPFRTQSDTEVLLRLYEHYGIDCIDRLRGMFAFALWDGTRRTLLLARDRMGKKPLFYQLEDGCLYFASTLRALRDTSTAARRVNLPALDAFLRLGYIPAPLSIEDGICKLPAGCLLSVTDQGITKQQYWTPGANGVAQPPESFAAAVDRAEELLTTAVTLRLRSDVPLGVFLSGGIDSSLVAAIAARQAGRGVHTFSIGFDDPAFDESAQAERVARHLGTEHRTFVGRGELFDLLPDTVRHFGEPFGDATALAVRLLAQQTRQHVTVALSGDGGDEAFGGYEWYGTARRLRGIGRVVPRPLAALGLKLVAPRFRRVRQGLSLLAAGEAGRYGALRTFLTLEDRHSLYAGELAKTCGNCSGGFQAGAWIADLYEKSDGSGLRRMRIVDVQTYLADCLMPKVDVPTMAYGLEARAPLLDQEVVAFALTLPDAWLEHPDGGKRVLRTLLERYLPASLLVQRKRGFNVPLDGWLSRQLRGGGGDGPVASLSHDALLTETGWFNPAGVRRLVSEHLEGRRDHSQRLYNLLVLREWLRAC